MNCSSRFANRHRPRDRPPQPVESGRAGMVFRVVIEPYSGNRACPPVQDRPVKEKCAGMRLRGVTRLHGVRRFLFTASQPSDGRVIFPHAAPTSDRIRGRLLSRDGAGCGRLSFSRRLATVRLSDLMVLIALIASILVAERMRERQVYWRALAAEAGNREPAYRNFAAAADASTRMAADQRRAAMDARSREYWSHEEATQAARAAELTKKAEMEISIRRSYESRRW